MPNHNASPQVWAYPRLEHGDEFGRHVMEVVLNIEADDPSAFEMWPELASKLPLMDPLHDEDDVGRLDVFGRQGIVSIGGKAGRCRFHTRIARKYKFGSG